MTKNNVLNRFHIAQLFLTCVIAGIGYLLLDDNQLVPVHWNIWGEVDNQWPAKWALVIGPALAFGLFGVFAAISTKEGGSWLLPLTSVALTMAIMIEAIIVLSGMGANLNVPRIVTILVGLLLMVVGNFLPKSQPNRKFGVRLPWTLNSPNLWAKTNLFAGWLFILLGAGCAVFAAVAEVAAPIYFLVLVASSLVATITILIFSYQISKTDS